MTATADVIAVLEDLSRLVLTARTERGLTVRAAAREAGVNFSTLSRCERGDFGRDRGISLGCAVKLLRWINEPAAPPFVPVPADPADPWSQQ